MKSKAKVTSVKVGVKLKVKINQVPLLFHFTSMYEATNRRTNEYESKRWR